QEGLSTRGVSSPIEPRWLQLLCLSFVVMRCQPLRRALALFQNSSWSQKAKLDLKFFLAIFQEIV
ncbi:hypothetical protein BFX28_18320, partial [Vibrio cholerae]